MGSFLLGILSTISPQTWAGILVTLVSAGFTWGIGKLQKNSRTANLAGIFKVADDALEAAITAGGTAGWNREQILHAAKTAALKTLATEYPLAIASSEASVETLVLGHQSQQLAPGGSVVNMPSLVPTTGGK